MRWARAVATLVLVGSLACTGNDRPGSPRAAGGSPTPHAIPTITPSAGTQLSPGADPLTLTDRSGQVSLRVTVSSRRIHAGETVSVRAEFEYGDPPYRPGGFGYSYSVDGAGGATRILDCVADDRPPRPFNDNEEWTFRLLKPGPHAFSISGSPGCAEGPTVSVEGVIEVLQPTAKTSVHRFGSDGVRSVDLIMVPKTFRKNTTVWFFASFERTTDEPMSWRLSFGDGTKDKVGGHACRPEAAGADDTRFDRAYDHFFSRSGTYEISVDLSDECLMSPDVAGKRVVSFDVNATYD